MAQASLAEIGPQLKEIVNSLYMLIAQGHGYQGRDTTTAMTEEITRLVKSLTILTHTSGALPDRIPPEVIEYVERSRNPDIYTREFVELVQRLNQKLKGRAEAYAQFRDALAREFAGAVPDAKDDVWCVVEATGGRRPAET